MSYRGTEDPVSSEDGEGPGRTGPRPPRPWVTGVLPSPNRPPCLGALESGQSSQKGTLVVRTRSWHPRHGPDAREEPSETDVKGGSFPGVPLSLGPPDSPETPDRLTPPGSTEGSRATVGGGRGDTPVGVGGWSFRWDLGCRTRPLYVPDKRVEPWGHRLTVGLVVGSGPQPPPASGLR